MTPSPRPSPQGLLDRESPLALELERGREHYNRAVAVAQRRGLRLSTAALGVHLCEAVAPIVAAIARLAPARVPPVTEALFELSLELVAKDVVGPESRRPQVRAAWSQLLPRLARPLALEPQRLASAVTNAVHNLALEPSARPEQWMRELGDLAEHWPDSSPEVEPLLACGKVLAWRAGMAHWRGSALQIWDGLPDPLALAVLGWSESKTGTLADARALSERRQALRTRLADPWALPEVTARAPALRIVGSVGSFRGFGGPFVSPPMVYASGATLWARDAEATHSLHADGFGKTLRRAVGTPPEERPSSLARLDAEGTVTFGGLTARVPALAHARGFAAVEHLLAVTLPRSHHILLVARLGGEPCRA